MEEVPQGSFQDELDWCISQLETGLLCLNPTPKQAEETRRILGVLRSHKAPFVKKRQVMRQVFGDYRLKMAEERKRVAKAAMKPGKVQIQPGDALPSGSMVYRKQSSRPPETLRSRFARSNNSFQFDFDLSERAPCRTDATAVMDASEEQPAGNPFPQIDENGRLDFSTGAEISEFAFNFVIPNSPSCPSVESDPGLSALAEGPTDVDSSSIKTTVPDNSIFLNPDGSDAVGGTKRDDEKCPTQGIPSLETAQAVLPETKDSTGKEKKPVTGTGESCKKKKKKKKCQPSKVEQSGNVNRDSKYLGKGISDEAETCQADEQLKREVDWCVEQLELGLKTQKSTPKQKDEALRAIKTLSSGKAALPKKRQIMRAMFGDYRTKMAEERRKQLKLMQAASVVARIAEVTEDTRRTSSQVFRKSAEAARRSQAQLSLRPPTPPTCPGAANPCSFVLTPSKEEFHFNFFSEKS